MVSHQQIHEFTISIAEITSDFIWQDYRKFSFISQRKMSIFDQSVIDSFMASDFETKAI